MSGALRSKAQIIDSDPAVSSVGCAAAQAAWDMYLLAHSVAVSTPGLANLLSAAYWLEHSVNQIAFRQLAHFNFVADVNVVKHLTRMFSTVGNADVFDERIYAPGQALLFVSTSMPCKGTGWFGYLRAAFPGSHAILKVL